MAQPADLPTNRPYYQRLSGALMVGAVLVQLALFAWASGPGLAGTSDSRLYLHAAQTLRDTGHLLNPDGTPYRYWPPLYPVLMRVCGSLAGIRVLHGICLVGSLLIWSWLGRRVLAPGRTLVLPVLLALSTPWLLVSKFVWAETVFLLLFAGYVLLLFQWLRAGRWQWWAAATAVGFLLPLQRTLGLFLLAGVGVGLLLGAWQRLLPRRRWLLAMHLAMSVIGGVLWQWYALLVAGPSRYHPGRGWAQLLSSSADYGFVLGRWLLPLPTGARMLLPDVIWAGVLLMLFALLWPRHTAGAGLPGQKFFEENSTPNETSQLLLRTLWSTTLVLVGLVAALTVFAQSAAGIHDAERYASIVFAPIVVLVLAAWPARAPRWLGLVLVALWVLSSALRASHVANDLHKLPPIIPELLANPAPNGQRVGALGQ